MEWAQARACFEAAVAHDASAEALEGLGLAAWWLDDAATMFEARERAFALYRREGDRRAAARIATLLGIDHYQFRGEAAVGNGWFRRAERLLGGLSPCPEHGWLRIWEGQIVLLVGNDPAAARRLGGQAAELGRSLALIDIEMTGLGLERAGTRGPGRRRRRHGPPGRGHNGGSQRRDERPERDRRDLLLPDPRV